MTLTGFAQGQNGLRTKCFVYVSYVIATVNVCFETFESLHL